ncbi:hypothetical protein J6590_000816 [Homalodisca vitripennis]|nr:hypothetical protein J6590_000816 [Homalodisca vitripennis]
MIWCEDTPLATESRNRPQSPQLLSNNVYTQVQYLSMVIQELKRKFDLSCRSHFSGP